MTERPSDQRPTSDDVDDVEAPDEPIESEDEAPEALVLGRGSFASAVGGAMLGLEQALRSLPPPEVMASEQQPERDISGSDGDFTIEFPDDLTDAEPDEE